MTEEERLESVAVFRLPSDRFEYPLLVLRSVVVVTDGPEQPG